MVDHHSEHEASEIDCRAALTELSTYLDGELTEARRSLISHHLDDCNPCLEIYDFEAELRMVIQKRCQEAVPDTLRLRVEAQLRGFSEGADDAGTAGTAGPAGPV